MMIKVILEVMKDCNISYCDGCIWCREDSLSSEEYGYYNSCQNENSENYYAREDELTWMYPDGKCPDKERF